jgi:hypothetical protein
MPRPSPENRLGRLSVILRAERAPFYQRQPLPPTLRANYPNEGWYWIPPGANEVAFLARDAYDAYHRLMRLLEQTND